MRKENSKYVERDGPIRDGCPEASQTCQPGYWLAFDGQACECRTVPEVPSNGRLFDPPGQPGQQFISACCEAEPNAPCHARCSTPSGGGGASCPQDLNYPSVSSPFGPFRCCMGAGPQSCGDDNGDGLCGLYWDVARTNSCMADEVNTSKDKSRPNMKTIRICPKDVPGGFWQNGQNALPSCTGAPPIRNHCKSDSDCDTGYSCHRNKCKKRHGGHKRKKDQPSPGPSPGPSPVTGQGNKGGMSGGEIAGIVVGSVAGAILLLLAVGALLRGSGKKGKKK